MVFEKVAAIIADKLELQPEQIKPESNFTEMQVDSLYMVEILLAIEGEFNVTIDDPAELETVADLVKYVESNQ